MSEAKGRKTERSEMGVYLCEGPTWLHRRGCMSALRGGSLKTNAKLTWVAVMQKNRIRTAAAVSLRTVDMASRCDG